MKYLQFGKCPVCGYGISSIFYDAGSQPLATLAWPNSQEEAFSMEKHAHQFVQCVKCSHVWNNLFDYNSIPYKENPNKMYNRGSIWSKHLIRTCEILIEKLPSSPTIIDIGCGDGHFISSLAELKSYNGRFIGFDPNSGIEISQNFEFNPEYFTPEIDIDNYNPDCITIRHVLEHMTDPGEFIDKLAWHAINLNKDCRLFVEVPCIDRVFSSSRLSDFFYEHVSHFSTESFRALMNRAGEIELLEHGYEGEVIFALVKLSVPDVLKSRANESNNFNVNSVLSRERIRAQLRNLYSEKKSIAIWGGTGKAAAFINQFQVDALRFPLVVDSDFNKVGTFVPGSGQEILYRDILLDKPVDIIIIPTQWRAKDIYSEIISIGIKFKKILIEHNGSLIDYCLDKHPYK